MNERDHADVEIYIRPPGAYPNGQGEFVWESSYRDFARRSVPSIVDAVAETADLSAGYWQVGIRERGDEQYFQNFHAIEPHAENRADALLRNHLHGVLNHWRA